MLRSSLLSCLGLALAGSTLAQGGLHSPLKTPPIDRINFEGLVPGTILSTVNSSTGNGPVLVTGINPSLTGNAAVVFDSANPTGGDFDLGTPNEDFGGPGIGDGGSAGAPFQNNIPLRKVLIVAENLVDVDGDGLVDDPDDADFVGSSIELDFSSLGTVTVLAMNLLDVENDRPNTEVRFFAPDGTLLSDQSLPQVGDNGLETILFGNVRGVARMLIILNGSGAIDNIAFRREATGTIGDTVFCDENDNGAQDPGEPGIPGVTVDLLCAGFDGQFGTQDDIVDSAVTDADGMYLFTDLPAGICRVTVDVATAPADKVVGRCPTNIVVSLEQAEDFLDADFCFVTPGRIGDSVFCDLDGDGVQDAGEPGIEGVTVDLVCDGPDGQLGTADDYSASTVTDADGMYLFENVPPGQCRVTVDPATAPDGKVLGDCPEDYLVLLMPGESYLEADFCFITPATVGDTVFCDLDGDGVQDAGEPGIAGVTVILTCAGPDGQLDTADDIIDSMITDSDGMYLFEGVLPGLCRVAVDPATAPADKILGDCPDEYTIVLHPDEAFLDADFCYVTPGEVGDFVWCDVDLDGEFDAGEPGIEGVTVTLTCAGEDGQLGTFDDVVLQAVTDQDGMYLFTGVPPGTCEVVVDSASVPGGKVEGDCPTTVPVQLSPGESFLDADFCFITPPGSIGDFVWCDENDDGVQDAGEEGIPGVGIMLRCEGIDGVLGTADDLFDMQVTDQDGMYLFDPVPAGLCEVTVDLASGPDDKLPGTNCPDSYMVDLQPEEAFLAADFCFTPTPPASVGDFVWCDLDDDGVQDLGEPGIGGVIVDLACAGDDGQLGTADDFTAQTTTAANGFYLFENVPPGECRVTVDPASAPSDKVPGTNCPPSYEVTLAPADAFLDADFCFITPPGSIGDLVFCDLDDDGQYDVGEPGIGGVRVVLNCAGPDGQVGTADDYTDSTITAADGSYLFEDVPPGDCRVTLDPATVPTDKLPGRCPDTYDVALAAGQAFLDADFCFVTPGTVGDFVWCDLDDDGVQDPGEPGIEGVTVTLTCEGDDGILGTSDDVTEEMVTGANGQYLFENVPPGACQVEVDPATGPEDKELGQCPPLVVFALAPDQAFLDADFCFVLQLGGDCCEYGKPTQLTFLYTGEDCSATVTTQDPGKVNCSGDPGFATPVFVLATDDEDPFKVDPKVWFSGVVPLGGTFTMDSQAEGDDHFPSASFIHVFDETGTTLLQTLEFHTSCSQPLFSGDQFGSMLLIDCVGEDEPIPGDCCANGRPRVLTMTYTGDDCSATSHLQDPGKVNCSGDPAFEGSVFIVGSDSDDPYDAGADIWFEGPVQLGDSFDLDAANAGQDKFSSATFVYVFDAAGTTLLQSIEFHTSCSQPLFVGNQFGSLLLIDCIGEDEPGDGGGDDCSAGKPQVLTVQYTGEDCSATVTTQDPDKVSCAGDPAFAQTVVIRASDSEDPDDNGASVWFQGTVTLDSTFDIDATAAGESKLSSATFVHIFDSSGTTLLQSLEFHTSCSQPLAVGNQFGACLIVGYTPEP